ncbi:MAG: tetratricopeptide repeat protein [Rubrivivax sp.]
MSSEVVPRWRRLPWTWVALAAVVAGAALAVWGGSGLGGAHRLEIRKPAASAHADAAAPRAAAGPAAPGPAASAPHALGGGAIDQMAAQLQARLERTPDDADGWAMLARTLAVGGRHEAAVQAFRRALALRPDDALLLVDCADALAMTRGGRIAGEPAALVQRALTLSPGLPKALSLAGSEAFERQDWAAAVRHWEQLQQAVGADNVFARQVAAGLAQARQQLAGPRS